MSTLLPTPPTRWRFHDPAVLEPFFNTVVAFPFFVFLGAGTAIFFTPIRSFKIFKAYFMRDVAFNNFNDNPVNFIRIARGCPAVARFPLAVMFPLLLMPIILISSLISLVACLFDSYFWDDDKRKRIKRSYLQALKHLCRCLWACAMPLWDVKKTVDQHNHEAQVQNPEDYAQPKGFPAFLGGFFFLHFFVVVPISNTAADFNFAGDLLSVYNNFYVTTSILTNPVGSRLCCRGVWSPCGRVFCCQSFSGALEGAQTWQRGSGDVCLYSASPERGKWGSAHKAFQPRVRSRFLQLVGTVVQDLAQLIIVYFISGVTGRTSSFYFNLAASIISFSFFWSTIFSRASVLGVFGLRWNLAFQFLFFCAFAGGLSPLALIDSPIIPSVDMSNANEANIVLLMTNVANITIDGNSVIQTVSFPNLVSITGNITINNCPQFG